MAVSRRAFIGAAAAAAAWPLHLRAQAAADPSLRVFTHGVASGDPLRDRLMLWTRVTPPPTRSATGPIEVRWLLAADDRLQRVVTHGTAVAAPERDFTVKVDAGGLEPGRTYYYAFEAGGDRSTVGRTRTLPDDNVQRLRFASVSCANYPAGYFNVYRRVAARADLDAVIHVGDYIYEFANGIYGDGTASGRVPLAPGEAITLTDYRLRYATYRRDTDLQAAHAQHPFIAVWDDHELANDAWRGGAVNHNAGEGDWAVRRAAAYQAYLEWMPVREQPGADIRLYRDFRFGGLVDLLMLDTRGLRDRQLFGAAAADLAAPARTILGAPQEAWLAERLRASQRAETRWRLLGQQVMFSPLTPPFLRVQNADMWDGYPAARDRVFEMLARDRITDVAVLTGDAHSSWALDVPRDPWRGYTASTGQGSRAIELVTPAISSPPLFTDAATRDQIAALKLIAPHLKFLDGDRRGYIVLDITRNRLLAEWYFVPTVEARTDAEVRGAAFVCEHGSSTLAPA